MTAQILDGKKLAARLREDIAKAVAGMKIKPGLAVILVGDDPASHIYVSSKIKACREAGIESFEHRMDANSTQAQVRHAIKNLNANRDIHGILLQLPLPQHLDESALVQAIDPAKDIDGLTVSNIGKLVAGLDGFVPCTPQGALLLIKEAKKDLTGLNAVVIGRSLLFGKPMAQLLLAENCTVTQAHSKTKDLAALCRQADILIAAVGRPNMVKGDWVKPGAIVIDVGINRLPDGKVTGDVDFDATAKTAAFITPVPGGVGPMTIACLLKNTVKAASLNP
jgi:methylenetetrahydrofolate dehydrogenase (NADP+)/methenyltetrahydrofolate cyclohydrolase